MKFFLSILLSVFYTQNLFAQEVHSNTDAATDIESLFLHQLSLFPQEKIYIQTDKPTYVAGETMWMRIHLTDAVFLQQANASRYVYVELLNPLNKVAQRIMIRPDSVGYFYGQLVIDEILPEGDYVLRAYTQYMRNIGEEYFFRRPIHILDPLSAVLTPNVTFTPEKKYVRIDISFSSLDQKVKPETCSILLNEDNTDSEGDLLSFDKDTIAHYQLLKSTNNASGKVLLLKTVYEGKKYHRFFRVPNTEDTFDVKFFPEGGQAIYSTDMQMAFKAMNAEGQSEHITGNVYDNTGAVCTTLESTHLGMGVFRMYYHPERTYYVVCTNQKNVSLRFDLPVAQSERCALKVIQGIKDIRIAINKAENPMIPLNLRLIAHVRGVVLYSELWDEARDYVTFDKNFFPSGIVHLLLIDENRNILSERLFFSLDKSGFAQVHVASNKPNYEAREKIVLDIAVTNENKEPLKGNFSLSVVDKQDIMTDRETTIVSTLLLTSELKGHVESPMSYLKLDDRKASRALDILMMTQGWRKYSIPELLKGTLSKPSAFPIEISQCVSGSVSGFVSAVKNGQISLIAMRDSVQAILVTETNKEGKFAFKDIEFPDSTWYIVQALTKGGSQRIHIELDKEDLPKATLPAILPEKHETSHSVGKYVQKSNDIYSAKHGMRVINLAEVEIVATAVHKKQRRISSPYYSTSTSRVITKQDILNNRSIQTIYDLLRLLPGVSVNGEEVRYRQKSPLLILDNIPMEGYEYNNILVNDIDDAFVASAQTVMPIFGTRAVNGAIVISTRKGIAERNTINNNIQTLNPIGYQQTVEFYSPTYETEVDKQSPTPDLRTTVFWQPDVRLDNEGKASATFYAADSSTTYEVIIEGLSELGHLIFSVDNIIERNREFNAKH